MAFCVDKVSRMGCSGISCFFVVRVLLLESFGVVLSLVPDTLNPSEGTSTLRP